MLRLLRGEAVATGRHIVATSLVRRESCGCAASLAGEPDAIAEVVSPGSAHADFTRLLVAAIKDFDTTIPAPAVQTAARILAEYMASAIAGRPAVAGELARLVGDLYLLAPGEESAAAIVDAFMSFGRTAAAARCGEPGSQSVNSVVVRATMALSEVRLRIVYEQGESFRSALSDEYDVNMELLRGHGKSPRELGWLRHTRCSAGVLGLWTADSKTSLQVVGQFDRNLPPEDDFNCRLSCAGGFSSRCVDGLCCCAW